MTNYSVWGDSPPPGTYNIGTDGSPSIATGHRFYTYGDGINNGHIAGAKLWIPDVAGALPTEVTLEVFGQPLFDENPGAPLASKTVSITAVAGSWQSILLDTPIPVPPIGEVFTLMVKFPDSPTTYFYSTDARPNPGSTSSPNANLAWSESSATEPYFGTVFRLPSDGTIKLSVGSTWSYGIDAIITDTPDIETPTEVVFGATVVEENDLGGSARNTWFDGVDSETMPSFARSTFYAPGGEAEFSVDYNQAFTFDVYRLGYYQGNGARLVESGIAGTPVSQPAPVIIPESNGALTCSGWEVNAVWTVPANALPGWYQVLFRGESGELGHALFCVSDHNNKSEVLVVSSDTTWHAAYNGFGGNNVYGASTGVGAVNERALCSTYDKPVITRDNVPQTHFFNGEYATIKFFERVGLNVGYATLEQIENDPTMMDGRQLIVFSGHNEYISPTVMNKTKALLSSGQNFLNLAGNDFFWRIKFTDGAFDSNVQGRVMWCKKDTMAGPGGHVAGQPFTTMADWTGTWQDSRWVDSEPSWEFFGDRFIANGLRDDEVRVPASMKNLPIWRDCAGIQALSGEDEFSFGVGTAGMEWDYPYGDLNQVKLSKSSIDLTGQASDINGENYGGTGTYEHAISIVKPSETSGIIANFNTTQWGWALDNHHLRGTAVATSEAQQATINILADLGVTLSVERTTSEGLTSPTPTTNIVAAYGLGPAGETVKDQLKALGYQTYVIVRL